MRLCTNATKKYDSTRKELRRKAPLARYAVMSCVRRCRSAGVACRGHGTNGYPIFADSKRLNFNRLTTERRLFISSIVVAGGAMPQPHPA